MLLDTQAQREQTDTTIHNTTKVTYTRYQLPQLPRVRSFTLSSFVQCDRYLHIKPKSSEGSNLQPIIAVLAIYIYINICS